jgi:hypothetical protein
MIYQGTGKLKFEGKNYRVILTLDPHDGYITAKFPIDNDFSLLQFYNDKDLFRKTYSIQDLRVELPQGTTTHNNLRNLHIKSIRPGTMSVYDSFLIRSLHLYENEIGIFTIVFHPQRSLLEFNLKNVSVGKLSELVFNDVKIASFSNLQITLQSRRYQLLCDKNTLVVKANVNLLHKQVQFYRVLSLLNGGKVTYRVGFYKNDIQINFIRKEKTSALGSLFKDDNDKKEFIEKYWQFENALNKKEKNKHHLFIEYFLEGMSYATNLENRIISLYTALEIIDNSRTLNKQSISKTLKLDQNVADVLARFRNKLIHQGYTGNDALSESIKEVKANTILKRMPFKIRGHRKTRILFNYYLFLVIGLYKKCFKDIGFANRNIQFSELMK